MKLPSHPSGRVVGIIGGMGPVATCLLFERILANTPARYDQEHLHIIIDNDPSVPDRTEALFGRAESPIPWLVRSAKLLEKAGAHVLGIPCVTAHAFLPKVREESRVPIISMVEETDREVTARHPGVHRLGILATDGTLKADVFASLSEGRQLSRIFHTPCWGGRGAARRG